MKKSHKCSLISLLSILLVASAFVACTNHGDQDTSDVGENIFHHSHDWIQRTIGLQENATYLDVADINGDGLRDVVTANTAHNSKYLSEVAWYKRVQGATWEKIVVGASDAPMPIVNATGIAVADLDNDGRQDIVVASSGEPKGMADMDGGGLYWYRTDSADFNHWERFDIEVEADNKYYKVYTADVEGDGDQDILVGGGFSAVLFVNPGNPAQTSATWQKVALPAGTGISINLADMNADGRVDLLSSNTFSKKVSWVEINYGQQGFTFSEHVVRLGLTGAFDIMAMDVDRDGRKDIVVSKIMVPGVHWFKAPKSADGEWVEGIVDASFAGSDLYVGDIDLDGREELVVSGFSMTGGGQPDSLVWFEYLLNGEWIKHTIDQNGIDGPGDVSLDDINGDGLLDVVIVSYKRGLVVWYDNRYFHMGPGFPKDHISPFRFSTPDRLGSLVNLTYNGADDNHLAVFKTTANNPQSGEPHRFIGQLFDSDGNSIYQPFVLSESTAAHTMIKAFHIPRTDRFFLVFGRKNQAVDVFVAVIDSYGNYIALPQAISDQSVSQNHFSVAFNTQKREFFITYNDSRNGYGNADVFGVRIDEFGKVIRSEFLVNGSAGNQFNPYVCYNPLNDSYLINWEDFRFVQHWTEPSNIVGALLDSDGNALVNDIPMMVDNGTDDEGDQRFNHIVYNPDRNEFLVSWTDTRPSFDNVAIGGRIVAADGSLPGDFFALADGPGAQMIGHVDYVDWAKAYFVVFENDSNDLQTLYFMDSNARTDIYSRLVHAVSLVGGPLTQLSASENNERFAQIEVSPSGRTITIAWQEEKKMATDPIGHMIGLGGDIVGLIIGH